MRNRKYKVTECTVGLLRDLMLSVYASRNDQESVGFLIADALSEMDKCFGPQDNTALDLIVAAGHMQNVPLDVVSREGVTKTYNVTLVTKQGMAFLQQNRCSIVGNTGGTH